MFTVPVVVKLPLTWSVLPSFTWNVPLLVKLPPPLSVSVWPDALARTVPPTSFTSDRPLLPMMPAPWMVLLTLVRVKPPTPWSMRALPPPLAVESVTVPPPCSVVLASTIRAALKPPPIFMPPPPFNWMLPWLVIVPSTWVLVTVSVV